jgi:hypothetical protein
MPISPLHEWRAGWSAGSQLRFKPGRAERAFIDTKSAFFDRLTRPAARFRRRISARRAIT